MLTRTYYPVIMLPPAFIWPGGAWQKGVAWRVWVLKSLVSDPGPSLSCSLITSLAVWQTKVLACKQVGSNGILSLWGQLEQLSASALWRPNSLVSMLSIFHSWAFRFHILQQAKSSGKAWRLYFLGLEKHSEYVMFPPHILQKIE